MELICNSVLLPLSSYTTKPSLIVTLLAANPTKATPAELTSLGSELEAATLIAGLASVLAGSLNTQFCSPLAATSKKICGLIRLILLISICFFKSGNSENCTSKLSIFTICGLAAHGAFANSTSSITMVGVSESPMLASPLITNSRPSSFEASSVT